MGRLQNLKPRLATSSTTRLKAIEQNPASTPRLRGRAGVERRARYLAKHPLCELCKAEGETRMADVVDHKVPLWAGGEDDYETNGQSLCHPHHDAKTAEEAKHRAGRAP